MNEEIKITDESVKTNEVNEEKEKITGQEYVRESGFDNPEDKALSKDELRAMIDEKHRKEKFNTSNIATQEVKLPSAGYFGGPISVRIRRMTTAEEKIIYTSKDANFITDIVKACVVDPILDIDTIAPADIIFLIYAIRNFTFGEKYKQESICPDCGTKQIIEVDITEFETKFLDREYVEDVMELILPDAGDTIKLRLMSEGEIKKLDNRIMREVVKKNIEDADGYDFMKKLVAIVESINGELCTDESKTERYLTNLSMRDYNKIRKQSNEAARSYGLDTSVVFKCKKCKELEEVSATIAPEFFRPAE